MANYSQGYINKHKCLLAAGEKTTQPAGKYEQTLFFRKGVRMGRLAVYEHSMEWEVFADGEFTRHVDRNDPDCHIRLPEGTPCTVLNVVGTVTGMGFEFECGWAQGRRFANE